MTRHQVRYGTLSDGHLRVSKAARYYAAIREMWSTGSAMKSAQADALAAHADLLEAKDDQERAMNEWTKLRAKSKAMHAENRLVTALISVEESNRILDELNKIRLELKPEIEAKYPLGIEQAEPDIWAERAKFEINLKKLGYQTTPWHMPLDPYSKAKIGVETNSREMALWMEALDKEEMAALGMNTPQYLELRDSHLKSKALKSEDDSRLAVPPSN